MKNVFYNKNISYLNYISIIYIFFLSCEERSNEKISCDDRAGCPDGLRCIGNYCVDPFEENCQDVTCPEDMVCYFGTCFSYYVCYEETCPDGTICSDEGCVEDPCLNTSCPEGMACFGGTCFFAPNCNDVNCPEGYLCYQGECIELNPEHNPCAGINCQEGEICHDGICYNIDLGERPDNNDTCFPKTCPSGWVCEDGECIPLDERWHEPIIISDPWFMIEGVVLDKNRNPIKGMEIFVQGRLTPFTSNAMLLS
jgi:hypothetical protein